MSASPEGYTGQSNQVRSKRLFAGEVVDGYGIFEERVVAGDDGDAAFGDEITLAVGLGVVADRGAFRNVHIAIENGFADAAAPADANVRKQNAIVHFGVRIDPHIRREHRIPDRASGNDAAIGDNRIQSGARSS